MSTMPVTVLPSVMQVKKDSLIALDKPLQDAQGTIEPPKLDTPPPVADGVSLTRAEYNELQGAAGQLARANDRLGEMSARLTELEGTAKATPKVEPKVEPARSLKVEAGDVALTEQEEQEFGNSKSFIRKLVRMELAEAMNPVLEQVEAAMQSVRSEAKTASTTASDVRKNSFLEAVQGKVGNLQELISHKHWPDFLNTVEPTTGDTYAVVLQGSVNKGRVDPVANVYRKFEQAYGVTKTSSAAYAGAAPSGGAATTPVIPEAVVKLKGSDRKKAGEDFRMSRITWKELQEVDAKYKAADTKGNVDWNQ